MKVIMFVSLLSLSQLSLGCGNDDDNLDSDTETETDTDTETESEIEMPPDLGVCEPIIVSIPDILTPLEGLGIEEFLEASKNELTKRSPQLVSTLGLSESFGMEDNMLDDVSFEYQLQTHDLASGILEMLREFDTSALTHEQRINFESYDWYLENISLRTDFIYHPPIWDWMIVPPWELEDLLLVFHPIVDLESAENYISRLNQVDDQFACFKQNLLESAEKGLLPSTDTLSMYRQTISPSLMIPGNGNFSSFYTTFKFALDLIDDLSDSEKEELLTQAEQAIENSVVPAHSYLFDQIVELEEDASEETFLWQYPDGDSYYDYLLRYYSGLDIDAEQALEFGLAEVTRIRAEMDDSFETLDYPDDETLAQLFDRVADDSGYVEPEFIIETFEDILSEAESKIDEAFDIVPVNEVIVVGGGGWYYSSSPDGILPGEYHVEDSIPAPVYVMKSVTYHEAVPGHHFQIAIADEFASTAYEYSHLMGYTEGWALYAERVAKEMGWYEKDVYGDLGRLQAEMLRALRVVIDVNLQINEWTPEEAVQYLGETLGYNEDDVFLPTPEEEVGRYINSPATVPCYKLGMKKFLELRIAAMDALGDSFDLKAFHRAVLVSGENPFTTMEYVVQDLIDNNGKARELRTLTPQEQQTNRLQSPLKIIID